MRSHRTRAGATAFLCALVFVATGCGGAGSPAASETRQQATKPLTGAAREAVHPDPNYDMGYTVLVTAGGFLPKWLVSGCCHPITWKNETGATLTVDFDYVGGGSGPIAPGDSWVFTPTHAESIAYHSGSEASMSAVVQVQQTIYP